MRHEIGRIDRDLAVIVAAEGGDAAHVEEFRRIAEKAAQPLAIQQIVLARQRRVGHAVDAEEHRSDPLAQPVRVLGVDQKRAFSMGMGVDEARRHRQPPGVDHTRRLRLREIADRLDAFAPHADIGPAPGTLGTVDDGASGNNQIKHASSKTTFAPGTHPSRLRLAAIGRQRWVSWPHSMKSSDSRAVSSTRTAWPSVFRDGPSVGHTWTLILFDLN